MNRRKSVLWLAVAIVCLTALACGPSQAVTVDTAAPTETLSQPVVEPVTPTDTVAPVVIVHVTQPADPPTSWVSEITDRDSSVNAAQRRANGGENFSINLFERPFNAGAMDVYYPDLDILRARLAHDTQWIYVTIALQNAGSGGGLGGNYGVEFDLNVDGRGDLLVFASAPGPAWSTDGVGVWEDQNYDVGSVHPMETDAPVNGDGYETRVFNAGVGSDPDLAWARVSPLDPKNVQIALKRSAISDDGMYTWGAWTDLGVFQPAWFDYSDHFTFEEAGSPLTEQSQYYPLKALFELDNTCRWAVGFTPTGSEPGICPVPQPGIISGTVYDNGTNSDLVYHAYSIPRSGIAVHIRSGSCSSPGAAVGSATTNSSGGYSFSVPAGTYCVDAATPSSHQTDPQTVTVGSGATASGINFFYWFYLGMR